MTCDQGREALQKAPAVPGAPEEGKEGGGLLSKAGGKGGAKGGSAQLA